MLYSLVRAVHLLSIIAWLGGLVFTLVWMRPALAGLDAPQRLRLTSEVLTRFFRVVVPAAVLAVLSGAWLLFNTANAARRAGIGMNMPLDWHAMLWLGVAMAVVVADLRWRWLARLRRAVGRGDRAAGDAALAGLRAGACIDLALGIVIVVVTRVGLGA